ncbi:MAG: copper(I)-binding protein [Psychrosphaera sp.]|jgi:copper(I)-binding protein|uniref:Copper chaperone PCu(A)C n=1 Tax=Psychrosphaera aquimarina TaxID=2044854 RepID=A0ABU3QY01_9GAMM|nr:MULTISPECIES: copper chaperone PCu(A)C [Psychrosphaera]MBU2919056.1 copper chaperone PCu(A)C [Psychrosphaera sp. F3M07]MDU0112055.1 copper chaperone PCu(A)C [Psychrosphaera aquimarina]
MKLLALLTMLIGFFSQNTFAQSIEITDGELRAPIPGMENTVAYMKLSNLSDKNIKLIAASSVFSEKVEIHNHIMNDGVMKMVKLDDLSIKANETKIFESGGLHLMFIGLHESKDLPKTVDVSFVFQDGTKKIGVFNVKSIHQQHHHH